MPNVPFICTARLSSSNLHERSKFARFYKCNSRGINFRHFCGVRWGFNSASNFVVSERLGVLVIRNNVRTGEIILDNRVKYRFSIEASWWHLTTTTSDLIKKHNLKNCIFYDSFKFCAYHLSCSFRGCHECFRCCLMNLMAYIYSYVSQIVILPKTRYHTYRPSVLVICVYVIVCEVITWIFANNTELTT